MSLPPPAPGSAVAARLMESGWCCSRGLGPPGELAPDEVGAWGSGEGPAPMLPARVPGPWGPLLLPPAAAAAAAAADLPVGERCSAGLSGPAQVGGKGTRLRL